MSTAAKGFTELQLQLADHIRTRGQTAPPADAEERRLKVYRDLFYNNVKGFLDGGFPVCRSMLGKEQWDRIATAFFKEYPHQTPYFLEISAAFLDFLNTGYAHEPSDPPWLNELAHYEWLELAVDVDPTGKPEGVQPDGDILTGVPVTAPACQGFLYQYPVHTIAPQNPSPEPCQTALVVYRDEDEQVRFTETNPFTLSLLALVSANPDRLTGLQLVETLLQASGMEVSDAAMAGGCQVLQQWHQQGILVGTQSSFTTPGTFAKNGTK